MNYRFRANRAVRVGNLYLLLRCLVLSLCGFIVASAASPTVDLIRPLASAKQSALPECLPFCAGMQAWWRCEGITKEEVSGDSGALLGGATFAPGLVGQAFSFGGGRDAVLMSSTTLASPFAQLTAEAWVYPLSHGSDDSGLSGRTILSKNSHGFALRVKAGYLQAQLELTGRSADASFNGALLPLNEWSHVAMVYGGASVRVYLNGQSLGAVPASGLVQATLNRDAPFMVGNEPRVPVEGDPIQPSGFGWHGLIDEPAVFDRALSGQEIGALYQARGAGKCLVPGFAIIQHPGDQKVFEGEEALFNVLVEGSNPVYQWFHNGVAVPGATNSSLRVSSVRKEDGGDYFVRLIRCQAPLQSQTARLAVQRLRTVALISPVNGGTYPSPTSLAIGAVVSDQDETITQVEFYEGTSKIGEDTTAPYGMAWTHFTVGDYALTARMLDNTGLTATSAPVHITITASDCLSSEPIAPVDLSKWTVEQFDFLDQGNAVWQISPDNSVAAQIFNADASILLSDFELTDTRVRGTLRVDDLIDDDFIGFVFGYRDNQHFYLFDWKSGSPTDPLFGFAPAGMSIKVVNSATPLGNSDLSTGSPDPSRVRTIYHNSIPWQAYTDYQLTLDFLPGTLSLTIKSGQVVVAIIRLDDSTYSSGRFGFYNFSQGVVIYRGFTENTLYALPWVILTRPVASSAFVRPVDVVLAADASSCGVPIVRVEFLQGGVKIGESTQAPFAITWTNVPAGNYSLTARAVDGRGVAGESVPIAFSVGNPNSPPVITGLTDQSMNEDASAIQIPFLLQDLETPATNLIVSVLSSNPSLLPQTNIVLSGFGTNRTLQLTPAKDQFGAAILSVKGTDSGGLSVTNRFNLTVLPVNDPPTLSAIANIRILENPLISTVGLTGISSGASNEFQNFSVTATSDNPGLIANVLVDYSSPEGTGTVFLQPLPNANGTALITVTVHDDGGIARGGQDNFSRQFIVTVVPATLEFSAAHYTVSESSPSVTLEVRRNGNTGSAMSVGFSTANGTANADDYTPQVGGILNFAPGETKKPITVSLRSDTLLEDTETFSVTLENPTGGAALGATTVAVVSIEDNDFATQPGSITYLVDTNLSRITLSGSVSVGGQTFDLKEQSPGSLTDFYGGTLIANVDGGRIQFLGGNELAALENKSYRPGPAGVTGTAPASYGGTASGTIIIFSVTADVASRRISYDVTSPSLAMTGDTFPAGAINYQFLKTQNGVVDFAITGGAKAKGSKVLGGLLTNGVSVAGTLTGGVLNIPVDASFRFVTQTSGLDVEFKLFFKGRLVAKASTKPDLYTISASAASGGSISPNGSFQKVAGTNQAFTASPNANYAVNQWMVDGNVVQNGGTSYTLSNIQAEHSVQVTFTSALIQYRVGASAGSGGTINPSGIFTNSAGDNQMFTASPNANYAVNQWMVDGNVVQNSGTSYTLSNIQAEHAVQVTFTYLPPGTLQFSGAAFSAAESAGTTTITATRTGGSAGVVGVSYVTANGTATAGADYMATSGTLSWADGDTANKTFTVMILDDTAVEGNETVNLTLSSPTGGATLGTTSAATLTIVSEEPSSAFVRRQLPGCYVPGIALTVTLNVTPTAGTASYVVEDQPPAGWSVSNISSGGAFDQTNRKVKYGPFSDNTARTLTYQVTPPSGETDVNSFSGVGSANGVNSPIGGDASIDACQYHPADNNPGNFAIAANEVTAYASAWKRGDTWPIAPNPIPADYITRAGALWKRGENYRLDPTVLSGPPLWWVNVLVSGQSVPAPAQLIAKQAVTDSIAVSTLPATYALNVPFTVTIAVKPDSTVTSYVVEDQTPLGWVVSDIDNSGSFDTNSRKVKWGLFFDNTPRTLTYQITPPSTVSGTATFTGLASFDGVNITITGQRSTTRAVTTNTPPTISSITDLTIDQNSSRNVEFSIDDVETPNSLTVSSSSSNPVLVPNANITLGGSGPFRTVIITPAINQTGTATITVTVSDGSLTASNSFVLTVVQATNVITVNDYFTNRFNLTGSSVTTDGSNLGATKEPGEPNHAGQPGGQSVWWSWTAPNAGRVTITTAGSNFDTVLGVYVGGAVNALTLVASNDDDPDGGVTSRVTFDAKAGGVYEIAVDELGGVTGSIKLNITMMDGTPRPPIHIEPSGKNIFLTWPTNAASFVIEFSDTLSSPNWSRLTDTPGIVGDQHSLKIPATNATRFYRLRQQ